MAYCAHVLQEKGARNWEVSSNLILISDMQVQFLVAMSLLQDIKSLRVHSLNTRHTLANKQRKTEYSAHKIDIVIVRLFNLLHQRFPLPLPPLLPRPVHVGLDTVTST